MAGNVIRVDRGDRFQSNFYVTEDRLYQCMLIQHIPLADRFLVTVAIHSCPSMRSLVSGCLLTETKSFLFTAVVLGRLNGRESILYTITRQHTYEL